VKTLQKSTGLRLDDSLMMRVAGSIFVGLGLFCLASGKLTTLSCNRAGISQGSCQLQSSGLFDLQPSQAQPIKLHSAQLEDNPMDNNASRVLLQTNQGYMHFTSSTDDDQAREIVAHINNFIKEAETTSMTLHNDERGLYFPLGAFIITVGLGTLVFFRNSRQQA
jgi:hypothetical protein